METPVASYGKKIISFPGKARSLVWNYFGFYANEHGEIIKNKTVCRICLKLYSYTGNTTNLFSHLDLDHKDVYDKLRSPSNSQTTLHDLQQDASFQKDSSTFKALQKCIITASLPLSIVENDQFKAFIKVLDPMYELPKPQMILSTINEEYNELRKQVKTELKACTDAVISVSQQTEYCNIKCHYIVEHDSKLVIKAHTLQTSENNAELEPLDVDGMVDTLRAQWSLHQVGAVAVSKEIVLQSISSTCSYIKVGCFGHVINNVINNMLHDEMICNIVSKSLNAHKMVFTLPTLVMEKEKMHNYYEAKFCECVPKDIGRWDMLRRLLEYHSGTEKNASYMEAQLAEYILTTTEKYVLDTILDILDAFEKAARVVTNTTKPSLSLVLPTLKKLGNLLKVKPHSSNTCSDAKSSFKIEKVKASMMEMLNKSIAADLTIYRLGSILDPRTKVLPFLSTLEKDQVKEKLIAECQRVNHQASGTNGNMEENNTHTASNGHPSDEKLGSITLIQNIKQEISDEDLHILSLTSNIEGPSEPKKARLGTDNWLDDIMNTDNEGSGSENPIFIEVERYMAEPAMSLADDPLEWWSVREHIYPSVSKVMRKYLAIPASTIELRQILKLDEFKGNNIRDTKYDIDRDKILFLKDNICFTR